jgi:uncharacterized membrane protein
VRANRSFPTCGVTDTPAPDRLSIVVSTVVTGFTLTVAFGLLALGVESFWVAFVVGFGVVLPAAVGAVQYRARRESTAGGADRSDSRDHTATAGVEDDALETLRNRYARGELTDAQFERKVERLLETEDDETSHAPLDSGGETDPHRTEQSEN